MTYTQRAIRLDKAATKREHAATTPQELEAAWAQRATAMRALVDERLAQRARSRSLQTMLQRAS